MTQSATSPSGPEDARRTLHDLENDLAAIRIRTEIVLADTDLLESDSQLRTDIEQIHAASEHALGLARQLLIWAREMSPE